MITQTRIVAADTGELLSEMWTSNVALDELDRVLKMSKAELDAMPDPPVVTREITVNRAAYVRKLRRGIVNPPGI